MTDNKFYDYVSQFGHVKTRSMFGGVGLFLNEAMCVLIVDNQLYLRGGGDLDDLLKELGCERYKQIKKQTVTTVNYFNITKHFNSGYPGLRALIEQSSEVSAEYRAFLKSDDSRRLRDLPNMQLTLERMVKRSGISDVNTFLSLGPVKVYSMVKRQYGEDIIDVRLLWKFAGAVEGVHWSLLKEGKKRALLSAVGSDFDAKNSTRSLVLT